MTLALVLALSYFLISIVILKFSKCSMAFGVIFLFTALLLPLLVLGNRMGLFNANDEALAIAAGILNPAFLLFLSRKLGFIKAKGKI